MRRCRYRPTIGGTLAAITVLAMLLLAGYIEVHAEMTTTTTYNGTQTCTTFCTGEGHTRICQEYCY